MRDLSEHGPAIIHEESCASIERTLIAAVGK